MHFLSRGGIQRLDLLQKYYPVREDFFDFIRENPGILGDSRELAQWERAIVTKRTARVPSKGTKRRDLIVLEMLNRGCTVF